MTSSTQEAQNYLSQLNNEYAKAEQYIAQLGIDASATLSIDKEINSILKSMSQEGIDGSAYTNLQHMTLSQFGTWIHDNYGEGDDDDQATCNDLHHAAWRYFPTNYFVPDGTGGGADYYHQGLGSILSDVKENEATVAGELEGLFPGLAALENTAESLTNGIQQIAESGMNTQIFASDLREVRGYLNSIFSSMMDQLTADRDEKILQNTANLHLTDAEIGQYSAAEISADNSEENTLNQLNTTLGSGVTSFNTQANNAGANAESYSPLQVIFSNSDYEQQQYDGQLISNAASMEQALDAALGDLAPAIARASMGEFTQLINTLNHYFQEIKAILANPNLSAGQKSAKILQIMMFVLGLFTLIKQEAQTKKEHNQQQMAQKNMKATKMNMKQMIADQQINLEEQANERSMHTLSLIADISFGVIFTLMAPGMGSAAVMATLTGLTASGTMGTLTSDLARAVHSQVLADALVTVFEIVVTAGGGAAMDALISTATKQLERAAVEAAEEGMATSIKAGAEKAAAAAGEAGNRHSLQFAENILAQTVKKAARSAAQTTARQFFNQNLLALAQSAGKSIAERVSSRVFAQTMKNAVMKAAKEAAETAVVDAEDIAEQAARRGVAYTLAEQSVDKVADKAAAKAVSSVAKISLEKSEKEVGRSVVGAALGRGGWAALFGLANSNFILDFTIALANKAGTENDSGVHVTQDILQVIQGLIQMLAFLGGSGMTDQASFENTSYNMMKAMNILSVVPQGMEAAVDFNKSHILDEQAKTTRSILITQAIADVLNQNMQQMQQDENQEMRNFIQDEQNEIASQLAMGVNLFSGEQAAIQILAGQAV